MASLGTFVEITPGQVSLENRLEHIAMEASFLANMVETIKSFLPDFKMHLLDSRDMINRLSDQSVILDVELTKKQKKIMEVLKQIEYLTFAQKIVSVPEQFKGNFIVYGNTLNALSNQYYTNAIDAINEYSTILSSFITNKDDKKVITTHNTFFKQMQDERNSNTKALAKFFDGGHGASKARLIDVVPRSADFINLFKEVNDLTSRHKQVSLKDIAARVDHCVSLLDIIINNVKTGAITNVSPEAVKNISTGAFEIGKYVEAVSVFYFDVMVYLNVVDGLCEDLLK